MQGSNAQLNSYPTICSGANVVLQFTTSTSVDPRQCTRSIARNRMYHRSSTNHNVISNLLQYFQVINIADIEMHWLCSKSDVMTFQDVRFEALRKAN